MFIGHFAIGFASKKIAPTASLGTLFLAAQLADLLWPNLVLLGVEHLEVEPGITTVTPLDFVSYPFSHSLVALCLWAGGFAWIHWWRRRSKVAALTVAGLVLSHWVLDVVTHRPDVPVRLGEGPRLGLGLWNSLPGTLVVEISLFAICVLIYAKSTRARDRTGRLALWGLVTFLVVVYFGNLFGPLPPSSTTVAWSAQAMWLLVAWGYWIDRHRLSVDIRGGSSTGV